MLILRGKIDTFYQEANRETKISRERKLRRSERITERLILILEHIEKRERKEDKSKRNM